MKAIAQKNSESKKNFIISMLGPKIAQTEINEINEAEMDNIHHRLDRIQDTIGELEVAHHQGNIKLNFHGKLQLLNVCRSLAQINDAFLLSDRLSENEKFLLYQDINHKIDILKDELALIEESISRPFGLDKLKFVL